MPVMGAVPGVTGAYIATGHNCWGMLNAPGSGLAMAELIADGRASSVDLGGRRIIKKKSVSLS
jgi:glycine/D-amino acid oxidase-like deaminating enzyme